MGDPNAEYVHLTFDDGPHPVHTPRILDILEQHQIAATFFLTGSRVGKYPDIARRIAMAGHLVGNHGYRHESHLFKPRRYLADSIDRTQDIIAGLTSKRPLHFRPPYGHFSPGLIKICRERSLRIVLWSNMPRDFDMQIEDDAIYANIETKTRNGSIIVLHDGHINSPRTVSILPRLIDIISGKGLSFASLERVKLGRI